MLIIGLDGTLPAGFVYDDDDDRTLSAMQLG
jgi:hypothetical protein